ncbi:Glutathione reductase, chloroplastic/mitochondrial [Glycine soja]
MSAVFFNPSLNVVLNDGPIIHVLPKPLNLFSILVSFSLSKPLNPKHLPTSRATLPLSPFLFLSLSLPLPKSLLSLSTRHRTFTVRAESQNGVNPVPTHYDFNLFTIGVGSDEVQVVRLATNYGTSVAICEFPFSTISSETTGGVGKT